MADIGRSKDDLGEHPGERTRFEGDGPASAVDGAPGNPATPAEQVDDDIARPRMQIDLGGQDARRWRRRDAVEHRQRVAGFGVGEGCPTGHPLDASRPALRFAECRTHGLGSHRRHRSPSGRPSRPPGPRWLRSRAMLVAVAGRAGRAVLVGPRWRRWSGRAGGGGGPPGCGRPALLPGYEPDSYPLASMGHNVTP